MWKKAIVIFMIISNVFLLTGCWNYVEIDRLINVSGLALDVGEEGKRYHLSAEIITVGSEEKAQTNVNVIESDGNTIFEAVRNLTMISSKKLYFGHCRVMIIGEELAKYGISEILDLTVRNHETRIAMDIAISKGCKAKDILLTEGISTPIIAYKIYDLLDTTEKEIGESPFTKSYKIFNTLQADGISTVIPALEIIEAEEKKAVKFCGVGVFDEDRLIEYLDVLETKNLSFINNKIKTGLLTIKADDEQGAYESFEIYKNKTQTKIQFENDDIIVNVKTHTEVNIGEMETEEGFLKTDRVEKIRQHLEKEMEKDLYKLINKAQTELESDIFGIGLQIYRDHYKEWEKYGKDWNERFKSVKFNVDCKVDIMGSGVYDETAKGVG